MASSSEIKKEMETGSGMKISVPASDQGQNGLHIAKWKQELLPLYSYVQQQQIGLNLMPSMPPTSIHELELDLAKSIGFIKTEETSSPKSMKLETDSTTTNYVINGAPISCSSPENHDINTLQKGKKIEESQTKGQLTLRGKNVSESQRLEWWKNWIVEPRWRKNGKYDKYYYHKYSNIMCRSLVEVDKYELYGIIPKRARKDDNYNAEGKSVPLASKETRKTSLMGKMTSQSFNSCSNTEDRMCFPLNNCDAGLKRASEKFLKESFDNLLNIINNDGSKSNGKKKKKRMESSKEKEGSKAASINIHSPDTKPIKTEDDALVDIPVDLSF